jgi:hypothetical protein
MLSRSLSFQHRVREKGETREKSRNQIGRTERVFNPLTVESDRRLTLTEQERIQTRERRKDPFHISTCV